MSEANYNLWTGHGGKNSGGIRHRFRASLQVGLAHVSNGLKIVVMLSVWAYAQQTPPASVNKAPSIDEAGKTLALCLAEVEHLRNTLRTPADLKILEAKLKAANELLEVYKADVDRLIASGQARTTASAARTTSYEERIKAFEAQLAADQQAFDKLRRENLRMRKGRNVAIGIIIALTTSLIWAASR